MGSDNPTGGDDQQETARVRKALDPWWIGGFVDGEGCFSVSIHRNPHVQRTHGWQFNPVFQVSQHVQYREVLEDIRCHFGVGKLRTKGPRSTVMVYVVDRMSDIEAVILPFFEAHPLRVKHRDFVSFAAIVRLLRRKAHLTAGGFERVVRLAYSMNANGKQRTRTLDEVLVGSSETTR